MSVNGEELCSCTNQSALMQILQPHNQTTLKAAYQGSPSSMVFSIGISSLLQQSPCCTHITLQRTIIPMPSPHWYYFLALLSDLQPPKGNDSDRGADLDGSDVQWCFSPNVPAHSSSMGRGGGGGYRALWLHGAPPTVLHSCCEERTNRHISPTHLDTSIHVCLHPVVTNQ